MALLPTPPAPKITTVCPARTPAAYTAVPQPVGTPQPVSAATSNGMPGSMGTQEFCEMTARCENVPSMQKPPRSAPSSEWNLKVPSASIPVIICAPQSHRFCRPVEQYRHVPQAGMKEHTTWSPTRTRVTPGPTASITPAPSWPPTIGSRPVLSPVCRCSSEWHMPDALKAIRTSPCLGSSSSSSVISHGLPGSEMIAALVRILPVLYLRLCDGKPLGAPDGRRAVNGLPLGASEGYGLRVGCFMVMVRRVRRGAVAPDLGLAPAG